MKGMALQVSGRGYGCFLSLVAHTDEDWIMVGAHNTVDVTIECQVHVGDCVVFFRKGLCWYLQNTAGCLEACEGSYHFYRIW
jgi:hypothetical protein